jgi:phage gpG-like protein
MADEIKIQVDDAALARKFAEIENIDATPLHAAIGATVATLIGLGFRQSTSPYGSRWKPLKIRRGQPLVDKGQLRSSITYRADNAGVTIGTNKIQARVHQFGATIVPKNAAFLAWRANGQSFFAKSVTIPARPFLPILPSGQPKLPPAWERSVVARLQGAIQVVIDRRGA